DVGVPGLRVNREIGHRNRRRVGPEQRGDLLIDGGDVGRPGLAGARLRAEVERVDDRRLVVGGEEGSVWRECQGTHRLQGRSLLRHGRRRGRLGGRGGEDEGDAGDDRRAFQRVHIHALPPGGPYSTRVNSQLRNFQLPINAQLPTPKT